MKRILIALALVAGLSGQASAQGLPNWPVGVTPPVFVIGGGFVSGAGVANGPIFAPFTNCTAPSYAFVTQTTTGLSATSLPALLICANGTIVGTFSATAATFNPAVIGTFQVNAIATTSTDSLTLSNATAATGGATVQMSPRLKWRGNAWDTAASQTVDFFAEVLPATAATPTGTWKLGYSLNGAAATYPMTVDSSGTATLLQNVLTNGDVRAAAGGGIYFSGQTQLRSTADKLLKVVDFGNTTGMEVNVGTPTLGTCTGGTLVSGAHNFGGEVTGNTSGSCVINFGTPNFTNTPFCFINDETTLTAVRISARSTSSITVTGAVSGDAFQFFCIGRIGT